MSRDDEPVEAESMESELERMRRRRDDGREDLVYGDAGRWWLPLVAAGVGVGCFYGVLIVVLVAFNETGACQ